MKHYALAMLAALAAMPLRSASADLYVIENTSGDVVKQASDGTTTPFVSGLTNPIGIAADPTSGTVYINQFGGDVGVYSSSGALQGTIGQGVLTSAQGMTLSADGADLYVANANDNTVYEYATRGANAGQIVHTYTTTLDNPYGVAVDGAGNVFVSNLNSEAITEFSSTGTVIHDFSIYTTTPGQSAPYGITLDGKGNLYVGVFGLDTNGPGGTPTDLLEKFDISSAAPITATAANVIASSDTTALRGPQGVVYDPTTGTLAVANYFDGSTGTGFIEVFGTDGTDMGPIGGAFGGLNGPTGLALAPTAVPEPASMVMLGLGLAGVFGYHRSRRSRSARA